MQSESASSTDFEVLIVGAGFGGLCMALRLQQAGVGSFAVLERSDRIGGTWRDNVYPGAGCDIPSALYSYSFAPHRDWSRRYAGQAEILAYLENCVDRYGIRKRLQFGRMVVGARFDEARVQWQVQLADGKQLSCRVLVFARGALSRSVLPDWPGLKQFQGPAFHTARWNRDCPLNGRRVAVIGTGASAVQVVPQLAPQVSHLSVFQRTPAWILPKSDEPSGALRRTLMRLPWSNALQRSAEDLRHEARALAFWRVGPLTARLEQRALRHLQDQIPDAALRARLTPGYRIGCKRVLLSSDFYPALMRDNVELVSEAVAAVEAEALVTADGHRHPVDAIVFATGFQAAEGPAAPIFGRGGQALGEAWKHGAEAYLGTSLAGFPNLFLLVGPNSGLGHHSITEVIEAQTAYVLQALQRLRQGGFMDLKPQTQQQHQAWLQQRLARSVWASGCDSWYRTRAGRNTVIWPGFLFELRQRLRRLDVDDYEWVHPPAILSR